MQSAEEAFDNDEHPLNLAADKIVWLGPDDIEWIDREEASGASVSYLWGDPGAGELSGAFVRLAPRSEADLSSNTAQLRSVLIKGNVSHEIKSAIQPRNIAAGGYFTSDAQISHSLTCEAEDECLIYVRTEGHFTLD